jgi:hypothetical protein
MYEELQWRFSKDESCSGVSQIAENCNGIYPINPIFKHLVADMANKLFRWLIIRYQRFNNFNWRRNMCTLSICAVTNSSAFICM